MQAKQTTEQSSTKSNAFDEKGCNLLTRILPVETDLCKIRKDKSGATGTQKMKQNKTKVTLTYLGIMNSGQAGYCQKQEKKNIES